MKKSVVKNLSVVIVSVIIFFSFMITSFGEFVILDDWIPFEIYTGKGTASVFFGDNELSSDFREYLKADDFKELIKRQQNVEISKDDYIVSEKNGNVVITLKEEFLETLEDGKYYFFAEFTEAQIPVVLYAVTEKITISRVFEFDAWSWTDKESPRVYISSYECDTFLSADLFESMSINGKELDTSAYTVSEGGTGVFVTLSKNYLRTLSTGEYYFDIDFLNIEGIKLKITVPPVYAAGDYNGDGKISASDARSVLRVSAKLEKANESQKVCTDLDANGKLTASDARRVLRIAAKIDSLKTVTVTLDKNEVFETPVMTNNIMNQWFCDLPDNSSLVCMKSDNIPQTDPFLLGGGAQRFTFTSSEAGIFNARFKYTLSWEPDSTPSDEIYYIITVE